jgi:hypothetical protein
MNENSLDAMETVIGQHRKRCVGEFMDENPAVFANSVSGTRWADTLLSSRVIEDADRHVVDKALGMLASVLRTAHQSIDSGVVLSEAISPERIPDIDSIEPDAAALVVFDHKDDEDKSEAVAFARTITLYKQLVDQEVLQADMLPDTLTQYLDDLPGTTELSRSVRETLKRLARLDFEAMMAVRHSE